MSARLLALIALTALLCQCREQSSTGESKQPERETELIPLKATKALGSGTTVQIGKAGGTEISLSQEEIQTKDWATEEWSSEMARFLKKILSEPKSSPAITIGELAPARIEAS